MSSVSSFFDKRCHHRLITPSGFHAVFPSDVSIAVSPLLYPHHSSSLLSMWRTDVVVVKRREQRCVPCVVPTLAYQLAVYS
ncbi:hypothetical protein NPIL_65891 [Nephila pilipes]|uniref:Uncharacterized protein n=1 Tax=Nephila pilipes TaxID=299642 RepID=A0A8X6QTA2_NEPPI|nr:hypothetical protein NPIL_65891 [Nephila pilipes]